MENVETAIGGAGEKGFQDHGEIKFPKVFSLIESSWNIYKANWRTFFGVIIIPLAVSALFNITSQFIGNSNSFFGFASFSVFYLLALFFQVWGYVALLVVITNNEEKISFREAFKRSLRKIHSYLWVTILYVALFLGGLIFFVVPAVLFALWFIFSFFILVAENEKGMNALLKSREYVRGHWWRIFGKIFSFVFLAIVSCVIFLLPAGLAFKFSDFSFPLIAFLIFYFSIFMALVTFILVPTGQIYAFLIYKHLKEIKKDFEFKPTKKRKALFFSVAIIGPVVALALTAYFILTVLGSIFKAFGTPRQFPYENTSVSSGNDLQIKDLDAFLNLPKTIPPKN